MQGPPRAEFCTQCRQRTPGLRDAGAGAGAGAGARRAADEAGACPRRRGSEDASG